jgi:hypothetical protein
MSSRYYSVDFGLVHLVSLDLNVYYMDSEKEWRAPQLEWFRKDLEAAAGNREAVPWIVVVSHYPMYCTSNSLASGAHQDGQGDTVEDSWTQDCWSYGGAIQQVRDDLEPLYAEFGVDARQVHQACPAGITVLILGLCIWSPLTLTCITWTQRKNGVPHNLSGSGKIWRQLRVTGRLCHGLSWYRTIPCTAPPTAWHQVHIRMAKEIRWKTPGLKTVGAMAVRSSRYAMTWSLSMQNSAWMLGRYTKHVQPVLQC